MANAKIRAKELEPRRVSRLRSTTILLGLALAGAGAACPTDEDPPPPVFSDPVSGLDWQNPGTEVQIGLGEAAALCEGLLWQGFDDWRLPTISELRSLVRGCAPTMTGGSCPVTDSCPNCDRWNCTQNLCGLQNGPGLYGCYWDPLLRGDCGWYWSATREGGLANDPLVLDFGTSGMPSAFSDSRCYTRCVRGVLRL